MVCKAVDSITDEYVEDQDELRYASQKHEIAEPQWQVPSTRRPDDYLCVGHLDADDGEPAWYVNLSVFDNDVRFKIDTGADVTCMTESTYKTLFPRPNLQRLKLSSPGGQVFPLEQFIGRMSSLTSRPQFFRIIVLNGVTGRVNLLSRSASVRLVLVQRLDNIDFKDIFAKSGEVDCQPVNIVLKEGACPYSVSVPRRIPFPLLPQVEEELK